MRRLRAFARLTTADRRIVLRAALALLGARIRSRIEPRHSKLAIDLDRAQHVARLLEKTAAALPFRTTCLQQAAALVSLLTREGIACDVCIGVRREGEKLEAHAWVEHEGVELLSASGERFVPFEEKL